MWCVFASSKNRLGYRHVQTYFQERSFLCRAVPRFLLALCHVVRHLLTAYFWGSYCIEIRFVGGLLFDEKGDANVVHMVEKPLLPQVSGC